MSFDREKINQILNKEDFITDNNTLAQLYTFSIEKDMKELIGSVFPTNSLQIIKLMSYFRELKNINVLIYSSQVHSEYLNHQDRKNQTIIMDLRNMKNISFINKKNRVCVVEPGVTFEELGDILKTHGMRPLAPFLPPPGKSVLAAALERMPHMIPKKQWDISDPLLCLEVIFGNGKLFRTGEAAGPQSIEKNRAFGAALTNPLGPGQLDLFRILQCSQGSFGAVSWASIQIDEIPSKRIINFVVDESLNEMIEFIYKTVRRRWIDEVLILNNTLFKALFPSLRNEPLKKYIMIYSINGYTGFLPEEKITYQYDNCHDILRELKLNSEERIGSITQSNIEPIFDGKVLNPHPKIRGNRIILDIYYNTTLDRIQTHLDLVEEILRKHNFPSKRLYIYIQPVVQARAVNIELSLLTNESNSDSDKFSINTAQNIIKTIAQKLDEIGAFFSRPNYITDEIAFSKSSENNKVYIEALQKLKRIFDPDNILNNGIMIF